MTARLLIDCDANVDALDLHRNTSLHVVVQNAPAWELDVLTIIDLLCSTGAHLDLVNVKGKTALESISLLKINRIQYLRKKMDVIRLKCLCGRLIREQNFTLENVLSKSLINFIQQH
jgi:hypothetical protein